MLAASMDSSTQESSGFSSTWIAPVNVPNLPRTLVSIRYRATNPSVEWVCSRVQTPIPGASTPWIVRVMVGSVVSRFLSVAVSWAMESLLVVAVGELQHACASNYSDEGPDLGPTMAWA